MPNLYQLSTLSALLLGDFEPSLSIGELKRHGTLGIGTFEGLGGELIILKTVESTLSQIRRRRARGTSGLWPSSP